MKNRNFISYTYTNKYLRNGDKTLSPERAQIYKCAHKTDSAADSNEAE